MLQPQSIKDTVEVQPATFGAPLELAGGTSGQVVLADDGVGVASDAREPPLSNLSGKLALVDRGTGTFVTKTAKRPGGRSQGVIVADNVAVGLPGMGSSAP